MYDNFLKLSDENDSSRPDLSDIIANLSSEGGNDDDQDNEYISRPLIELLSGSKAINSIQKALLRLSTKKALLRRKHVR